MSSYNNTASNTPAITESMLADADNMSNTNDSFADDKDRIIGELFGHLKKQHRIIRNLNSKMHPREREELGKNDLLFDFIEKEVTHESLNAKRKQNLINRLYSHIEENKKQLSSSVDEERHPSPRRQNHAKSNSNSDADSRTISDAQRKKLEDDIKAELKSKIIEDLRAEIHAEINAQLHPGNSKKIRPETQTSSHEQDKPLSLAEKAISSEKNLTQKKNKASVSTNNKPAKITKLKQLFGKKKCNPAAEITHHESVAKTKTSSNDIIDSKKHQASTQALKQKRPTRPVSTAMQHAKKSETSIEPLAHQAQSKPIASPASIIEDIDSYPTERGRKKQEKASDLWPSIGSIEEDEDDEENDEIDNERLFSLTEQLHQPEKPYVADHNAPTLIEVTRYRHGQIEDLQHIAVGSAYYAHIGEKTFKLASNTKSNNCQFFYSKRYFSGAIAEKNVKTSDSKNIVPLRSDQSRKRIRYSLPPDKVVFLKAGNDEYRLRSVPTSLSPKVQEPQQESGKRFKHFLQYSVGFHCLVLLVVGLIYTFGDKESPKEVEPRFAQVDLSELNKKQPEPKPTPKPKAKPPAPKKVQQEIKKIEPKPAKPVKKHKITTKPTSSKAKPKNAGGGAKNGGNLKKRDVKSSGLLAALGTKKGKNPGSKQALATISSLDAVSTLNSKSATLKVGGLAAKVQGARIEVATGELIDTRGSTSVLRSGGAEGSGQIAALESGVTGNRDVRGKVSATLTRKVKINGGLSRDEVKRVIDAHMDEVVYCYEKTLASTPGLAGKAVFEWKVLMSGRVGEVNIKSSSLRSNQIHSCIKGAIKSWQFPQPTGNAVFVSFPFIFDSVEF